MQVRNDYVDIISGKKHVMVRNMILNSYLKLYVDTLIDYKNKELDVALINITNSNKIDYNSEEMAYNLEAFTSNISEKISNNQIQTQYIFSSSTYSMGDYIWEKDEFKKYYGSQILDIGFAKFDPATNKIGTLYAWVDVSKYNIYIQANQPLIISRLDKAESDWNFFAQYKFLKGPYHLATNGYKELVGMDAIIYEPKLYSIGFGEVPYKLNKEIILNDKSYVKEKNKLIIPNLETNFLRNTLYANTDILASNELFARPATWRYIVLNFHLWTLIEPESSATRDTGLNYLQYKEITKHGLTNLEIKFERG